MLPQGKPGEEQCGLLEAVVNGRGVHVRVMNTFDHRPVLALLVVWRTR
ncbi:hypothetical protein [Actinophytocola sp. KF-1]